MESSTDQRFEAAKNTKGARQDVFFRPPGRAARFRLQRSRQKPRLLPAATKLLSEKSAAGDFFPMN
jgi:hypothetical protein